MSDPYWCNGTCGYTLRQAMLRTNRKMNTPEMDIEVIYETPLINDGWWVAVDCPHGNTYWLRPSLAQLKQWEAEGTL